MLGMSFSDTLTVAGIVISVLFGFWGIYLVLRRARYPGSLTFVREQSLALLDDFATRIPNLAVLYKDTPISKSVVLLSGYLANDGSVDLTPEMTEKPLTCTLPGSCTWLEFKPTGEAENLKVTGEIVSDRVLELTFGLFRRDEAFSFQALALLDDPHSKIKPAALAEKLHWSHRIASLGDVKTITLPLPDTNSRTQRLSRKAISLVAAAFYVFLGLSQLTGLGPLGRTPSITYVYEHDGKMSNIQLTPNHDGTTTVTDLDTKAERDVLLEEMAKGGRFKPVYQSHHAPQKMTTISGWAMVLMAFFMVFQAFSKDYRRYRVGRLVAAAKTPSPSSTENALKV
ncbi:hypothetical protein [Caballeronia sp. KNU42]